MGEIVFDSNEFIILVCIEFWMIDDEKFEKLWSKYWFVLIVFFY